MISSHKTCLIDTRYGRCFDTFNNGQCVGQMPVNASKSACCCAAGTPQAWLHNGLCEPCPLTDNDDYKTLCNKGPGYVEQPDGSVIGKCSLGIRPTVVQVLLLEAGLGLRLQQQLAPQWAWCPGQGKCFIVHFLRMTLIFVRKIINYLAASSDLVYFGIETEIGRACFQAQNQFKITVY